MGVRAGGASRSPRAGSLAILAGAILSVGAAEPDSGLLSAGAATPDSALVSAYRDLGFRAALQEALEARLAGEPAGPGRDSLRTELAGERLRDGRPLDALGLLVQAEHGVEHVWEEGPFAPKSGDPGRPVHANPAASLALCVALLDAGYLEAARDRLAECGPEARAFVDVDDGVSLLSGVAAHRADDLDTAIRDLGHAAETGETPTIRDDAERELLWALLAAGQTEAARARLLGGGSAARLGDSTFVLFLGERLVAEGRAAAAESLYDRAADEFREGPGGIAAFEALEALRAARGDSLSAVLHLRGAQIALAGRVWDAVVRHAARAEAGAGDDETLRNGATLMEGLAYYNSGRNDEAVATLERLRAASPSREVSREALIHLGRSERRRGRADASRRHYERFLVEFPDDPFVEEVVWDLGWRDLKAGKKKRALDRFREVGQRFPLGKRRPEALAQEALVHEDLGDPREAVKDLERLMVIGPEASLGAQATYFRARFLRSLGEGRRASALEESLVAAYPETFYGTYVALHKGAREAPAWWEAPDGAADIAERAARAYSGDAEVAAAKAWLGPAGHGIGGEFPVTHRLVRSGFFTRAGLVRFLEAEFVLLESESGRGPARDLPMARLYRRNGFHHRALTAGSRLATARRGPRPPEVTRFLFPPAYLDMAVRAARGTGVDPRLLLAVAREESWFEEDVVSRAGAIGLVQIMPTTGLALSESLGGQPATPHHLTKPETSLRLGATYLASLLREFGGSLVLATAAYNGGESNARDWKAFHRAEDPARSIESISFTETRAYVKKVIRSLWIYRILYPTAGEGGAAGSP
jgi:soluble lytic murein transglycosylase